MEPFSLSAALASLFSSPSTWLALGSQLLGTIFNQQANQRIRDQQAQAAQAESMRQSQIDQQRNAAVQDSLHRLTPQAQQQQQQDLASKLQTYLTPAERPNASTDYYYLPENPGAPKEIKDSLAGRLSDALKKGQDYAKNLAGISSYGQLGFNNNVTLNRLGEKVGQLNTNSANSSAVLPYELQASNRAGNGFRTAADIANGAGSILFLNSITGGARRPAAGVSMAGDPPSLGSIG